MNESIDIHNISKMPFNTLLGLFRKGYKLNEKSSIMSMQTGTPCDTSNPCPATCDTCYTSARCFGYKYWYIILPIMLSGLALTGYLAYKGIEALEKSR